MSDAIANGTSRTHSLKPISDIARTDRPLFVGELDDEIDDPGYLLSRVSGSSVVVAGEFRPDVGRDVVPLWISLAPKHVDEASGAADAASSATRYGFDRCQRYSAGSSVNLRVACQP